MVSNSTKTDKYLTQNPHIETYAGAKEAWEKACRVVYGDNANAQEIINSIVLKPEPAPANQPNVNPSDSNSSSNPPPLSP